MSAVRAPSAASNAGERSSQYAPLGAFRLNQNALPAGRAQRLMHGERTRAPNGRDEWGQGLTALITLEEVSRAVLPWPAGDPFLAGKRKRCCVARSYDGTGDVS